MHNTIELLYRYMYNNSMIILMISFYAPLLQHNYDVRFNRLPYYIIYFDMLCIRFVVPADRAHVSRNISHILTYCMLVCDLYFCQKGYGSTRQNMYVRLLTQPRHPQASNIIEDVTKHPLQFDWIGYNFPATLDLRVAIVTQTVWAKILEISSII